MIEKRIILLDYIGIEGTKLSSETSHTRADLTAQLSWQSIGLAFQRSQVRFPLWSGMFFSMSGVDIVTPQTKSVNNL